MTDKDLSKDVKKKLVAVLNCTDKEIASLAFSNIISELSEDGRTQDYAQYRPLTTRIECL